MEPKVMKCIDGFGPGEFPEQGRLYYVREYDNEALVEVWNDRRLQFSDGGLRGRFVDVTSEQEKPVSAKATQVGGTHYTKQGIQPYEYALANNLGGLEHTVVKYVTRWKDKGGVEDLKKARHTLDFLIEYTENNHDP